MGLDIYLYRVCKDGSETHEFEDAEKEPYMKYFGNKMAEVENEYINFEKTFEKKGLIYDDYRWIKTDKDGYFSCKKEMYEDAALILDGQLPDELLLIKVDDLVTFFQTDKVLTKFRQKSPSSSE